MPRSREKAVIRIPEPIGKFFPKENLICRITEQATHLCTNPAVQAIWPIALKISRRTIENHTQVLPESIVLQIADFLPPMGSFDDDCLRRYLET